MPPPATVPHHQITGNARQHQQRRQHNFNNGGNIFPNSVGGFGPCQTGISGTVNTDGSLNNPQLSTRFTGGAITRQPAGGQAVTEGTFLCLVFLILARRILNLWQYPKVYECQNIQHEFTLSELYEGLKLAQRGRLEDQRGTEIKFEMPDFLKREQQQVYTAIS